MNKTAIVSGATGNLGNAVVKALSAANYHIVGTVEKGRSTPDQDMLNNIEYLSTDLRNAQEAGQLVSDTISKYGSVDRLILLVGGFAMGSFEDTDTTDIHKMVQLNFDTAYNLIQPFLKYAKTQSQKRKIVLIGAKPAFNLQQSSEVLAYALSKSMLSNLAEIINGSKHLYHTDAVLIVPSIIDTPANRAAMPSANFSEWVTPQNIAEIIVTVCSDGFGDVHNGVYKVYGGA